MPRLRASARAEATGSRAGARWNYEGSAGNPSIAARSRELGVGHCVQLARGPSHDRRPRPLRVPILHFVLDAICATSRRAIEMRSSNAVSFTRRRAP